MIDKEKYLKAPWHDTKKELPDTSKGNRCVCYNKFCGCEMEMIFHRARKDSGYKDFFTECAKGSRAYDYDHIAYWRYFTDKEAVDANHVLQVHDVVKLHGVGGPMEGKMGEVTQVFQNGTYHVKAGIVNVGPCGDVHTSVYTIAVSERNLEYDEFATRQLRSRGSFSQY